MIEDLCVEERVLTETLAWYHEVVKTPGVVSSKGHNALAMVAAHGTPVEKKRVQRVVNRKYPGIGGVKYD